jgi:hypothetical protein
MARNGKGVIHGHTIGGIESAEYRLYYGMKNKCYNLHYIRYDLYGGRGIKVCKRWLESFRNFLDDMGKLPEGGAILGRLDENKDFSPDNCRWMSRGEYIRSLPTSFAYRSKNNKVAGVHA